MRSIVNELRVEFCDEWYVVTPGEPFAIGRDADLVVDDNPYLHRRFLEIVWRDGLWWLTNTGSQLSATISDPEARFQAWLAPAAHLPVVFAHTRVCFTAGPTTYEMTLHLEQDLFQMTSSVDPDGGSTTLGRVALTPDQRRLIVALAEPVLRSHGAGRINLPSSAEAARRLGWPITKFNRKLDNVCQKLKSAGVRGLHGEPGNLASDRRARLVEYAVAVRLVVPADLQCLDTDDFFEQASGDLGVTT